VALRPRFPGCPRAKEEAMAIGRTVVRPDIRGGLGLWIGPAGIVARSLVMITMAAFAILVLLPAAVAAQATVHV
jgi:hypothetical protein